MKKLQRALLVFRTSGPRSFIRFTFGRLIHREWRTRVYRDVSGATRSPSQWPPGYRFEICRRPAELAPQTLELLDGAGGRSFRLSLDPQDQLYFVWFGSELASFGGIFFGSVQLQILDLEPEAVLLGDCLTVPNHRGRGLYRLALNDAVVHLRSEGHHSVYIEAHPDNVASLKGIAAAGFSEVGLTEASIWFNQFVRRGGRWARIRR